MGIEVAIAAANFRMGRNLWLWNSIVFLAGLILKSQHVLTSLEQNQAILGIFYVVGISSIIAYFWFSILTRETFPEFCLDARNRIRLLGAAGVGAGGFFWFCRGLPGGNGKIRLGHAQAGLEWLVVLGLEVVDSGRFLLFLHAARGHEQSAHGMGYPRTVEGFFHAFTRVNTRRPIPPTLSTTQCACDPTRHARDRHRGRIQLGYMFLALVPFLFFRKMHRVNGHG